MANTEWTEDKMLEYIDHAMAIIEDKRDEAEEQFVFGVEDLVKRDLESELEGKEITYELVDEMAFPLLDDLARYLGYKLLCSKFEDLDKAAKDGVRTALEYLYSKYDSDSDDAEIKERVMTLLK